MIKKICDPSVYSRENGRDVNEGRGRTSNEDPLCFFLSFFWTLFFPGGWGCWGWGENITVPTLWRNFSKAMETIMMTAQTPETAHVGVWSSSLVCVPLSETAIILPPSLHRIRLSSLAQETQSWATARGGDGEQEGARGTEMIELYGRSNLMMILGLVGPMESTAQGWRVSREGEDTAQ